MALCHSLGIAVSLTVEIYFCFFFQKPTLHEFCVIELQVSTLQSKSASETDSERYCYRVATHVVNVSPKGSSLVCYSVALHFYTVNHNQILIIRYMNKIYFTV